jgi:hypothetical protein
VVYHLGFLSDPLVRLVRRLARLFPVAASPQESFARAMSMMNTLTGASADGDSESSGGGWISLQQSFDTKNITADSAYRERLCRAIVG